jgi:hypothetical protein
MRMLFSCTWKENRKKESDDVRRDKGRREEVGGA